MQAKTPARSASET
jgi:cold-inducible RNA-binding protein